MQMSKFTTWLLIIGIVFFVGIFNKAYCGEALEALKRAARNGDADSQYGLGNMHYNGFPNIGVPQDYKESLKWLEKAANQGHAKAQHGLGFMYFNGKGVPQDFKQAAQWFEKAANKGHAVAQGLLGTMYAEGTGVHKDYMQAYKWLNIAGASGDEKIITLRDQVRQKLTPAQIEKIQELIRNWKPQ